MEQTLGGVYLVTVLFLIVLAILWFILPFAIFGTKAKLDQLIAESKQTNRELESLTKVLLTASQAKVENTNDDSNGPPPTHDELMARYGISNDGEKYIFQSHRYDKIEDAVANAQQQARS